MSTSDSYRLRQRRALRLAGLVSLAVVALATGAQAQTLEGALARAYQGNPTLNAQRAQVRATDEQVPQALSGYRPTIVATVDAGVERSLTKGSQTSIAVTGTDPVTGAPTGFGPAGQKYNQKATSYPRGAGVTLDQNLFNGFQTKNSVRRAESNILGARETLRNSEQNVLFDAAQAYMDVLRDYAILDVRRNNVQVLDEELSAARERFQVGEVTRTDTAQAEAALQGARSEVSASEAQLNTSRAIYRQVVGEDIARPRPAKSIDRLLPKSLAQAIGLSQAQHPAILAALHGVDAANLDIRVVEGQLLPSLDLQASFQRRLEPGQSINRTTTGSVIGQLTIPIYQGGTVYSQARQAKETAGQRRLEADVSRDQVRQAVVSAWGQVEATTAQIKSAQAQIEASQTALNGVREEAKVGQRTTLDVLNAQQDLLLARQALITAQRDRVVAAYALLSSVGWLTADRLALQVARYDPNLHYDQVRDKWIGLRTPDGR